MTADRSLRQAELTERLLGHYYSVYRELGGGFIESVYAHAFAIALVRVIRGIRCPSYPLAPSRARELM